jgi:hypothetical protein
VILHPEISPKEWDPTPGDYSRIVAVLISP